MGTLKKHRDLHTIDIIIVLLLLGWVQENAKGETKSQIPSQPQQKSIVKTIQHKSGDVFDCYLINEQPSLRHPSMKGRKLKMKPALVPPTVSNNLRTDNSSFNYARPSVVECPVGTVPIRRYDDEHLSLSTLNEFLPSEFPSDGSDHNAGYTRFAAARGTTDGKYYGAKSHLGIWEVDGVGPLQKSAAFMWIYNNTNFQDVRDLISIGWAVAPHIYNDTQPRLTAFWRGAGKACLNTRCPGLVHTHPTIALGSTFDSVSVYKKVQIYLRLFIRRNPVDRAWYIFIDMDNADFEQLGYWDANAVPGLASYASMVQIGGHVSGPVDEGAPAMGDGHPPTEGIGVSSSVLSVFTVDEQLAFVNPSSCFRVKGETKPSCYSVGELQNDGDTKGLSFAYGGPSGCRV